MLEFTTINIDEEYKEWSFDSIEDLRKMWRAEDYVGPGAEDPVTDMDFCGIPMYVNKFDDIIELFGIDQSEPDGEEWTMKDVISTNMKDDGTLEIYLGNRLFVEVVDGRDDEEFVEDVIYGMGYEWLEDGTIRPIKEEV